jgi:DNA-binding transcriptional regulator YhcF (GntR family)
MDGQSTPRASVSIDELAVVLDRDAEVPLGTQLAWALRVAVARADVGQQIPGLRELAEATGLNVNTVRAVYQRLASEKLLETRQGAGTFVISRPDTARAANRIVAEAAREARDAGVDLRTVAMELYVTGSLAAAGTNAEAERRRTLRVQIAGLERTVSELEAEHPEHFEPPSAPPGGKDPSPRLPSAAELEGVKVALVRRLAKLHNAVEEGERASSPGPSGPAAQKSKAKAPRAKRPATKVSPEPA